MSHDHPANRWRVGLAIAASTLLVLGLSAPANASTTGVKWDTHATWDGVSYLQPFGNPDTATYGQTFTAPDKAKKLKKFAFYMAPNGVAGSMTFRAELYGWDNAAAHATDAIWESAAKTITLDPADPAPVKYNVKVKKGKVKAGQQYVMFFSISKDYEMSDENSTTKWEIHFEDAFAGGNAVWLNDSGDETQWTTVAWANAVGTDMAFTATFKTKKK
jgi:hypothetical protein